MTEGRRPRGACSTLCGPGEGSGPALAAAGCAASKTGVDDGGGGGLLGTVGPSTGE